jgi:outer membrane protein assembly factor BamB
MFLAWIALLAETTSVVAAQDDLLGVIQSRVSGGLIVQVGCSEHQLAERLAGSGGHLVQLLDDDPARVTATRESIEKAGHYGVVTVDQFPSAGKLPYAENLVNVVILAEPRIPLPMAEVVRVLRPGGWVIGQVSSESLRQAGLTDVEAIAAGSPWLVGSKPWPAQMDQWPQTRHSADGNAVSQDALVGPPRRVRWIAGPPQEISNVVSAAGRNFYGGVLARDAFNGLQLWQRKLDPSPARGGFSYSSSAAPRPIALGGEVLAFTAGKLAALDGATGAVTREYPEAGTPRDLLTDQGTIFCVAKMSIRAVDHRTGALRWKYPAVEPRCAVAGEGSVFFLEGEPRHGQSVSLVRLDQATGARRWQRKDFDWLPLVRQCVYHQGRVVCEISTLADEKKGNRIEVLSAADGHPLWSHTFVPGSTHMKQARAMFVGNALWLLTDKGCEALDPASGQSQKVFPAGGGHCFPPVATIRFVLHGEMHLTDLETGLLDANPITKGNCGRDLGFLPANGLIYTAPKHCVCWPMLRDYTALAPAKAGQTRRDDAKLVRERGPAPAPRDVSRDDPRQWPCYRHDAWRSASTLDTLPTALKVRWTTELGGWPEGAIARDWRTNSYVRGPVTPPVVSQGLVCVARPDAQQVVALDAATGAVRWRYTANGRIDTAPTLHRGLCLFGASSGWVYALRADDGRLVWRLRAAPEEERIVAYGQLESPWPVPGSVLAVEDLVYFAAGRHPLADGGIRVFAVQPASGDLVWAQRVDAVPQQSDRVQRPFYNSNGLEFDNFDLLHREGNAVAMSRWIFDRGTGKMTCDRYNGFVRMDTEGTGGGVWVPRGCWSYAPRNESEHCKERPFLRPLAAYRGDRLYSLSEDRKTVFRRDFDLANGQSFDTIWFAGWKTYGEARTGGDLWRSQRLAREARWNVTPFPGDGKGLPGHAMLLAANALVIAGGQGGLVMLSPDDGRSIGQVELPATVWDGLAAADGQLFATTQEGSVVCLGAK